MNTKEIIELFEKNMKCEVLAKTREQKVVATRAAIFHYLVNYKGMTMTEARANIETYSGKKYDAPTEATIYNAINKYKSYRNKYPRLDDTIRELVMIDESDCIKINCIVDVLKSKEDKLDKNKVTDLFKELNIYLDLKNNI
mgnify:FL=1|tara:strand:+ start:236 stop:658 length:423 start_codon:yes stop_codon:yes gene_type:complete